MAYTYDVAISFVADDEPLANQLREALAPLSVFLYSKKQEDLAGRDGVEAFREVFRDQSRLAVVLFRARWGKTPWTRVEETAIKDHCFAAGWEHLLFVKLEKSDKPSWVPDTRLYLDFASFGLADLVGAVKARCADLGVELRPISAAEKAKTLADAEKRDAETVFLLRNQPRLLDEACAAAFAAFERRLIEIRQSTGWPVGHSGDGKRGFGAFTDPISVTMQGKRTSTGESVLEVRVFHGRAVLPGESGWTLETPNEIRHRAYRLTRDPDQRWCWERDGRLLSPDALAEDVAAEFVEARGRHAPGT